MAQGSPRGQIWGQMEFRKTVVRNLVNVNIVLCFWFGAPLKQRVPHDVAAIRSVLPEVSQTDDML